MKIMPINNFNQHTNFKGLWGKKEFLYNKANSMFDCDYYSVQYFPFKDETKEEIQRNIDKGINKMNKESIIDSDFAYGITICRNYNPVIMPHLNVTKNEYRKEISKNITQSIESYEEKLKNEVL